jgi:hypothetical protein
MMLNKVELNIIEHVERVGWSIMKVGPRADSDDPQEWFAYTIGLPKSFGWPEMICFGLSLDLMGTLLNDAVAECRERNAVPVAGLRLSNIIKNADVKFIDGDRIPLSYLNSARWFAEHSRAEGALKRLQMLWPDKNGAFPGEAECEEGVRAAQTPLELLQ